MSKVKPEVVRGKTKQLSTEIADDNWQPAEWSKAEIYQRKQMITDETGLPYDLCVDTENFKNYGVGIKLFFDYMRLTAIIFWVMAAISAPAIYSNVTGGGLATNFKQSANGVAASTIANQPQLILNSIPTNSTTTEKATITAENDQLYTDWSNTMSDRIYWVSVPDLAYTVVFILFIWVYSSRSRTVKQEIDIQAAQPSHFTIQVQMLHPSTNEPGILEKHFQQFGKVTGVHYAKDYSGMLSYYKKVSEILHAEKIEEKKNEVSKVSTSKQLQKLQKERQSLLQKIELINKQSVGDIKSHKDFRTLFAFVTFDTIEAKNKCVLEYEKAWSFCADRPPNLKIESQVLPYVIKKVDNPSNIKWENLDATPVERCARLTCVILIILCVMILTIAIIFIANLLKTTSSQACPIYEITLAEAQASNDSYTIDCYCLSQSITTLEANSTLRSFCQDTILNYLYNLGFSVGTALIIVIVNSLLRVVIFALTSFSRYRTITSETNSSTTKLFVAMFINSAIISLILNADIFGFSPAHYISTNILTFLENKNAKYYADFDREWYTTIGIKILYSTIAFIFTPHLTAWLTTPCVRWNRIRKAKKEVLQGDMNDLSVGPAFDVTQYYAVSLNVIFITLTYCSAIPALLIMCALSLSLQYWSYKYLFLRYNKRPPAYDTSLNKTVISVLPYGVLLHILVGIYMYGQSSLFPKTSNSFTASISNAGTSQLSSTDSTSSEFLNRITLTPINIILFLIAALMIVYAVLNTTVLMFFRGLYRAICSCRAKKALQYTFGNYTSEYENISNRMIATYNILENETYAKLITSMENKDTQMKSQRDEEKLPLNKG